MHSAPFLTRYLFEAAVGVPHSFGKVSALLISDRSRSDVAPSLPRRGNSIELGQFSEVVFATHNRVSSYFGSFSFAEIVYPLPSIIHGPDIVSTLDQELDFPLAFIHVSFVAMQIKD